MANRPTRAQFEDGKKWEIPAAQALAKRLWPGAEIVEYPAYSHIDLAVVTNGKMTASLEVKRRYNNIDKYPTSMVLFEKHNAARFSRKYFKIEVYCLLVFDDAVALVNLGDRPAGKEIKGRWDRPGSEREYALYPVEDMDRYDEILPEVKAQVRGDEPKSE